MKKWLLTNFRIYFPKTKNFTFQLSLNQEKANHRSKCTMEIIGIISKQPLLQSYSLHIICFLQITSLNRSLHITLINGHMGQISTFDTPPKRKRTHHQYKRLSPCNSKRICGLIRWRSSAEKLINPEFSLNFFQNRCKPINEDFFT